MSVKVFEQTIANQYAIYNGDCIEVMKGFEDESIDYSIYSPPFGALYVYSNSEHDLSNCRSLDEFFNHLSFFIREQYRVMKPGRIVSLHLTDIPTTKVMHGYTGLIDFSGMMIKAFQDQGFRYASKVTIWKDPRIAAQRTKTQGLLYSTFQKDATKCRSGLPDYLISFKKPGDNAVPVMHDKADFSLDYWAELASPIWMDINPSDTLQFKSARAEKDEKHMTPTQLEVIRRGIELYSNKGEVILSPFGGIGSEGYVALKEGRRSISIELKESYYQQNVKNHAQAAEDTKQPDLFDGLEIGV